MSEQWALGVSSVVKTGDDSMTIEGGGFALLPQVVSLEFRLRARRSGRVPALLTQAVHGALGYVEATAPALRPVTLSTAKARWLGLTDGVPLPFALAPSEALQSSQPQAVEAGQCFGIRVGVIARSDFDSLSVLATLREACDRGLGGAKPVPFDVELTASRPHGLASALPNPLRITLATPTRIKSGGALTDDIDATVLWNTIARRAALLTALYCDEPLPGDERWFLLAAAVRGDWGALVGADHASRCPIALRTAALERVNLGRYSERQRRRMSWPGMQGVLEVDVLDPRCAPLLRFAEALGVGKNTSFGFGALQLSELASRRVCSGEVAELGAVGASCG